MKSSIPRRIVAAEFKREAIKLVTDQGLTFVEAGRKLDIATRSLREWIAQSERGQGRQSSRCDNGIRTSP